MNSVRCYIIVDPWVKILTFRYLESPGRYASPEFFPGNARLPVRFFEGLTLDRPQVFGQL